MAQGYGYRSEQRLRKENQDTLGVFDFEGFTLLVVCDGMGGHVGGRQASSLAVRTMYDELKGYTGSDLRSALRRAIESANRTIYETARKNYRLMGMGTTCVAAIVQGTTAHIGHVGDSRAYLVREGQIRALTRDHTMVNLFVDAELLSAEDAATHPEAHVLSRSLGVERQVEVDLAEPLALQQGDRILLCSDGVTGVVGTTGLGTVDWRNPQEGVDAAIDAVQRAEGDDNATLVAFGIGISGASAPPTAPPDLSMMEEEARAAPMQVPLQQQRKPTLVPTSASDQDVMPVEQLGDDEPTAPVTAQLRAGAQPKASPGRKLDKRLIAAGIGVGLVSAVVVAALVLGRSSGPAAPPAQGVAAVAPAADPGLPVAVPPPPIQVATGDLVPLSDEELLLVGSGSRGMFRSRCLDCTSSLWLPSASAYLSSADDPQVAIAFFAPEVPPAPRRVPNTTSVYDHPPPSGPEQTKAVRAARNKRCREALDTVREAIVKSIDYASLYGAAWYCFNDTHSNVLSKARASTWNDFRPLLEHFEGTRAVPMSGMPEPVAAKPKEDPKAKPEKGAPAAVPAPPDAVAVVEPELPRGALTMFDLPDQPDLWAIPAEGGIEYRLALFEIDDEVQGFRTIMVDLLGEPTVADHLATDVLLVATAAASSARMEEANPDALGVWARRVYVASRAMTGPVGELIRAHRPEIAGMIEALLFEATGGDEGLLAIEEGFTNEAIPLVVARAQAAGLAGQMENVLQQGSATPLLPPSEMASADDPEWRSGSRSSSSRRSYAGRRRDAAVSASGLRDPSQFDWESFGYLKVWYPRQRMPTVLLPYQQDGKVQASERDRTRPEDIEVIRRDKETLDADWSAPK